MTDTQLEAMFRPIVAATLKAQGITSRSADDDERQPYQPSDLPRFHDYYGASADGSYPGDIHEYFGVTPKRFAEATGLRLRCANGREVWL